MCYLTCAQNEKGIGFLPYRTQAIFTPLFPEIFSGVWLTYDNNQKIAMNP